MRSDKPILTCLDHEWLDITKISNSLKNMVSNKDIDVPAGYIGFSNDDGSLSSRLATADELADANAAATGGTQNELNLELKDTKGNRKELKLKYHR